jgi:uncharacterized protein YtpQ (UPF0354 family)
LSTNENVSGDDFANLVIEGLKNAGDDRQVTYDAEEFRLEFREENADCGVLNLTNLHAEYAKLDEEFREQRMSEIVRAALSHLKPIPEEFKDASYDLRPRLWARSTFESMRLRSRLEGAEEPRWPLEPIGENLYLSLVFDLPESVRSLSDEELENWGISYWEAREVAMNNLAEEELMIASLGDVLYASNTGDSYDATRLALTGLIEQLEFDGIPIAMVPNRDTLLLTGSNSEVGIKMMVELAEKELAENPRPLIATMLAFEHGEWNDWQLPSDHPSHEAYRRCVLGWTQFEYENQKKLLDQICDQELIEQFNASYTVISKDDKHMSYCVWGKDIISSLPRTDLVAFMDDSGNGVRAFASWDQVHQLCGQMMKPQDYYPARFRVDQFPSDEILGQLEDLVN